MQRDRRCNAEEGLARAQPGSSGGVEWVMTPRPTACLLDLRAQVQSLQPTFGSHAFIFQTLPVCAESAACPGQIS